MRLLPSEKAKRIKDVIKLFNEERRYEIYEPCDCGSRCQHNNGGNYHDEILLAKDSGRFFRKDETTSELEKPAEWYEITEEKVLECIEENSDWL